MPPFKLDALTEFNPAIICEFQPEITHIHAAKESAYINSIEYILSVQGQTEDVFNAYLYLQETILPDIKTRGREQITAADIISWVKGIHKRIAHSLTNEYEDEYRVSAGEFTTLQILRWHDGGELQLPISLAMLRPSDRPSILEELSKTVTEFCRDDYIRFFQIFDKFRCNHPPMMNSGDGQVILDAFIASYQKGEFSNDEVASIKKIITICLHPDKIPQMLNQYAQGIAQRWNTINPQDIDAVSHLGRDLFFGLADVHPFINGNGRTATALLNLYLRSLELPDILLRYNKEKADISSSYSRAIKVIETEPSVLIRHIKQRILDAQATPRTQHPEAVIVELRIDCGRIIREIQSLDPSYNLNKRYLEFMNAKKNELSIRTMFHQVTHSMDMPHFAIQSDIEVLQEYYLKFFTKCLQNVRERVAKQRVQTVSKRYKDYEVDMAEKALKCMTQINDGWHTYNTNQGLTILLHVDSLNKANEIAALFDDTRVVKATSKKISGTEKYVVAFTEIKPESLASVVSMQNYLHPELKQVKLQ